MVALNIAARAAALAEKLSTFLTQREVSSGKPLSQREVARLTGVSRSTLGYFLRDPERRSARTVANIEAALSSPALQFRHDGIRTTRIDAPLFTPDSIRSLSRPDGARGFAFVYRTDAYESGYGTTILSDVRSDDPEDALGLIPGLDAADIASVLWYRG